MRIKKDKRKDIIKTVEECREIGYTFSEIANLLNNRIGMDSMTGKSWSTRNLFNFYNRHIKKNRD